MLATFWWCSLCELHLYDSQFSAVLLFRCIFDILDAFGEINEGGIGIIEVKMARTWNSFDIAS